MTKDKITISPNQSNSLIYSNVQEHKGEKRYYI